MQGCLPPTLSECVPAGSVLHDKCLFRGTIICEIRISRRTSLGDEMIKMDRLLGIRESHEWPQTVRLNEEGQQAD